MRVVMLAISALAAALTFASSGADPRLRGAETRLPAPVTVVNGEHSFRIARDGSVHRVRVTWPPIPRGASWFPGTGTWFVYRHRHLVVGRGRRALWRSREQIRPSEVGLIAAGRRAVAFQHDHKLYLAPLGGAERPIAAREAPLGWTAGGLYTYSYPRRELLLRGETGRVLKVIAPRPLEDGFDLATRSLYLMSRGVLESAYGTRVRRLASLASLGLTRDTWLQPLGGLIELQGESRIVLLRPDGSVFASLRTPRGLDPSSLSVAAGAREVAFTTTSRRKHGVQTVYLLRAGGRRPIPLHREPGNFGGCANGVSLQWHDSWLLYSNSDGNLAAIDTAGAHKAIDLTALVKRVPNGYTAYWSGQPPSL